MLKLMWVRAGIILACWAGAIAAAGFQAWGIVFRCSWSPHGVSLALPMRIDCNKFILLRGEGAPGGARRGGASQEVQ